MTNREDIDADAAREALRSASIPCLLPVLYQLTGDDRWLGEKYRIAPTPGFGEMADGGLDEATQDEVRAAAHTAFMRWARGAEPAVPVPDSADLTRLMACCLGEEVPEKYAPMVAEQLGFQPYVPADVGPRARASGFRVLVIGAGVSGLAAARALAAAGVPYTVLEKNQEVGGTWWENRYPGARVDVPSNLYSYSFAPKAWSEYFSRRDEISDYLVSVSHEAGVRAAIRFGCEATGARWDAERHEWVVTVVDGEGSVDELRATALITAVGLHNRPMIPDLPGLGEFEGTVVHSAQWDPELRMAGRKVAVIGAGASAMQIVPAILDDVESLTVFQRSPHWIMPNEQYFQAVPESANWLLDTLPFYRQWYRFRLYWLYTERMYPALLVDPEWDRSKNSVNRFSEALRRFYTGYLTEELGERDDLVRKCTPDFPVFGKRILLDNGWYRALRRPHVDLVTESIAEVRPRAIRTAEGQEHEVDTVVLCTGFQQQRFLFPMEIKGVGGRSLRAEWKDDDARAYLGLTTPGYPNLFYLFGPNTNPPGGSWITIAEAQVRYVISLLTRMVDDGIGAVECTQRSYDRYNAELDERNGRMVFGLDGVDSYYRNAGGRVVTNTPWTVLQYWTMTREPDLADYTLTPSFVEAR
ncbi:flavin-containing monooxygenase [Nocardia higoensis]|uniref:flavin-containing monooxygenase n=1 Tax=Nocardia higoensis TaxID=228599 RepID=UPI0003064554|nr:NAD(P)/FAD-dependent oxidoreductase [Nocardia higoensis]